MSNMCCTRYPFASTCAFILSIVTCVAYCIVFDDAVSGFSMQLNTLIPIGSINVTTFLIIAGIVYCIGALVFLIVGTIGTFGAWSSRFRHNRIGGCLASRWFIGLFTFANYALLIAWTLVLCFTAILAAFYFIFIGAVYAFCALVDQQCFDFTVLLPALIDKLTHSKVDLTFCESKKEALCSAENNMIYRFIAAFVTCLLALIGLSHFLMCMAANYTRISDMVDSNLPTKPRRQQYIANTTGTVDSNSFIMEKMGSSKKM